MDNNTIDFIKSQPTERIEILTAIHEIILEHDKTVAPNVEKMMGKEMIIYKCGGVMKYGLSSVKKHISLHVMPIYCLPELHHKYANLLDKASFQKGCINFQHASEMPLEIVKQMFIEFSAFDFIKFREQYKSKKKISLLYLK